MRTWLSDYAAKLLASGLIKREKLMGGLLVASALTLFVLPVAYCAIHKIK